MQFQQAQNSDINPQKIPPMDVLPFVDVVVEVIYCVVVDGATMVVEVMDGDVVESVVAVVVDVEGSVVVDANVVVVADVSKTKLSLIKIYNISQFCRKSNAIF